MRPVIVLSILLLCAAAPSTAQDMQQTTVRIENGNVYLNGRVLESTEFPSTLRTNGQNAQFTFSGEARFYIDGRPFTVRSGRIVEVAPDIDDSFVVLFRGKEYDEAMNNAPALARFRFDGPPSRTMGSYARVLDARAARLEQLGQEVAAMTSDNHEVAVDRLRREAEEAAIMVRAFPRVEMQSYLQGIQGSNSGLYQQLLQELTMENETAMIAARIHAQTNEETRLELKKVLRLRLDEIFELKQQNRREEISQLEKQLTALREQLSARESNRQGIIDRRIEELLAPVRR